MNRRFMVFALVLAAVAGSFPATASASRLIARNASQVSLAVSRDGKTALVNFKAQGRAHHLLAWGAINARHPSSGKPQVRFRFDYTGGWGRYRKVIWPTFRNHCRPYDGPRLPWLLTACKARDGSYWALQRWQVPLPDLGFTPWLRTQRVWELHLSHWSGPIASLEAHTDWTYGGRYHSVFGRMTYRGQPVYGFKDTRYGAPLDSYGRLVYLDTFNSAYGRGWRRENSFLLHTRTGVFCYGFYKRDPAIGYPGYPRTGPRGPGNGERYRITVNGPGVTPDVSWQGVGLPTFDARNPTHVEREQRMNAQLFSYGTNRRLCHT